MKFGMLALFTSLVLAFAPTAASAAIYSTVGADPSSILIEIVVYDDENDTYLTFEYGSIGPAAITGTVDADVSVDGLGNGTLTYNSAALSMADVTGFIDVGPFDDGDGPYSLLTFDLATSDVGITLSSDAIPVSSNLYNLDTDPPGAFSFVLNQGQLVLSNLGGAFGGLLDDPTIVDLTADPLSVDLADLAGFNLNGTATANGITFVIPAAYIDVGESAGIPGLLFARLSGQINVVVPEPSSVALLGLGLVGLGYAGFRRRK